MTSLANHTARLAGLTYLLASLTGAFNLLYVPSQLIVAGDPAMTLSRLTASGMLFRLGIASGIISSLLFLILPVILYGLLKVHGRILAGLMVVFATVGVSMSFTGIQHALGIATLIEGAGSERLAVQVVDALTAHRLAETTASIFWGMWLMPLGWLIIKSGAIPRPIGVLLLLGCAGYLANVLIPLVFPGYHDSALPYLSVIPGSIGELGTCLWLLIMGIRTESREAAALESPGNNTP